MVNPDLFIGKDVALATISGAAGGVAGAVSTSLLTVFATDAAAGRVSCFGLSMDSTLAGGAAGSSFPIVGTIIGAAAGVGIYLLIRRKYDNSFGGD